MAVLLDPDPYRNSMKDLLDAATDELDTVWQALDLSNVAETRAILTELITDLGETYGGVIADMAVEQYKNAREISKVMGTYVPIPAPAPQSGQVEHNLYRALGSLLGDPKEAEAYSRVKGVTDRLLQQASRNTIDTNVRRDPRAKGYVRVPSGTDTCGFCLMVATKTYGTSKSAGQGNKYHDKCYCVPTAIFSHDTEIKGFDQSALQAIYEDAKSASGSSSSKDIVKEINRITGHSSYDPLA